jgi:repressor of nif and glnA expression
MRGIVEHMICNYLRHRGDSSAQTIGYFLHPMARKGLITKARVTERWAEKKLENLRRKGYVIKVGELYSVHLEKDVVNHE